MKEPTMFEVIGPIMIGPSSSHTAGALKISLIVHKILQNKKIKEVKFTLYNSFAKTGKGHGTDLALVAGILGYSMDDIRIRHSFEEAKKAGLKYTFEFDTSPNDYHPNSVKIELECEDGSKLSAIGESIGGGMAIIRQLNNVEVVFTGELNTIIVTQNDKPGVLAHITACLNDYDVNIAFARLYRESKSARAYTIIETDDEIPSRTLEAIKMGNNVLNAIVIDA